MLAAWQLKKTPEKHVRVTGCSEAAGSGADRLLSACSYSTMRKVCVWSSTNLPFCYASLPVLLLGKVETLKGKMNRKRLCAPVCVWWSRGWVPVSESQNSNYILWHTTKLLSLLYCGTVWVLCFSSFVPAKKVSCSLCSPCRLLQLGCHHLKFLLMLPW